MEYGQLIMSAIVVAGYIILLAVGNPHAADLKDLVSAVVIFYLGAKVGASQPISNGNGKELPK